MLEKHLALARLAAWTRRNRNNEAIANGGIRKGLSANADPASPFLSGTAGGARSSDLLWPTAIKTISAGVCWGDHADGDQRQIQRQIQCQIQGQIQGVAGVGEESFTQLPRSALQQPRTGNSQSSLAAQGITKGITKGIPTDHQG